MCTVLRGDGRGSEVCGRFPSVLNSPAVSCVLALRFLAVCSSMFYVTGDALMCLAKLRGHGETGVCPEAGFVASMKEPDLSPLLDCHFCHY